MGTEKIISIKPYKLTTRPTIILWDIQVSGGDTIIYNGIVIHNSTIERGVEDHIEVVNGFYRKDGSYVKSHTKKVSAKQGKKYIENSLKSAFNNFNSSLEYSLKRRFKKVI